MAPAFLSPQRVISPLIERKIASIRMPRNARCEAGGRHALKTGGEKVAILKHAFCQPLSPPSFVRISYESMMHIL